MKNNPVGWFEIYVQDMDRAQKFYEGLFKIKLLKLNVTQPLMRAFPMNMEASGASGALVKMDGFESSGNSILVYFSCKDCARETARVSELGGRIEREKFPIGEYGFIALVTDTEGNIIGLHSHR